MGLFGKMELDADVERALQAGANNGIRKSIARAQPFIKSSLVAGESLRYICYESYTGSRTVAVTDRRVLIIKNSFGGGSPKSLEHACDPSDIRRVAAGQVDGGSYLVVIEIGSAQVPVKFSDNRTSLDLTEAINELIARGSNRDITSEASGRDIPVFDSAFYASALKSAGKPATGHNIAAVDRFTAINLALNADDWFDKLGDAAARARFDAQFNPQANAARTGYIADDMTRFLWAWTSRCHPVLHDFAERIGKTIARRVSQFGDELPPNIFSDE